MVVVVNLHFVLQDLGWKKRHNYLKKVAEVAVNCFIQNDRVNVLGIVLAGAAEFKNELAFNEYLD